MHGTGKSTSVFTDDSGTRARVLQWTTRGVVGAIVVAVLVLLVSLVTGVPLPGLDRSGLLPGSAGPSAPRSPGPSSPNTTTGADLEGAASEARDSTHTRSSGQSEPSAESLGGPAGNGSGSGGARPTPVATATVGSPNNPGPTSPATPTSPGKKPTKGPNANSAQAPRADPTKSASGPPATPPGKAK